MVMPGREEHTPQPYMAHDLCVGDWRLRPDEGLLARNGEEIRLRPRAMEVLALLATRPGRVVSKGEIFAEVWEGNAVEDGALAHCISEIRNALGDTPRSPRYIETLPKRGYRLVAPVAPAPRETPVGRDRGRRLGILAVTGLLVGLLAWWTTAGVDREVPGSPYAAVNDSRPRVAVLGFSNLSGDPRAGWLSTALSEMLTTELAVSEVVQPIPGHRVARIERQLSITDSDRLEAETLRRLGAGLGVDFVVVGSYLAPDGDDSDELRIDLRVQDRRSGEIVAAVVETGTVGGLADLVSSAGRSLRHALGDEEQLADRPTLRGDRRPWNPTAARLFYQGLLQLRRCETAAATELLERSAALEPEAPRTHFALAEAWSLLGYERRAIEAAERALALSDELPREERLWIEARCHGLATRWDEAIERLRALRLLDPSNLDYGLELARMKNATGHPLEALSILDRLHKDAPSLTEDPRLSLAEAEIARDRGDLERQRSAAERAAESGRALGARSLLANALLLAAEARHHQGETHAAAALADEARGLIEAEGGRRMVADALVHRLDVVDAEAAGLGMTFEEALDLYRQAGDRRGIARALIRLARTLTATETERAEQLLQEALALASDLENSRLRAEALNRLAVVAHFRLDSRLACERFEAAVVEARASGDLILQAGILANLSAELLSLSEAERARPLAEEALSIARRVGSPFLVSLALIKSATVADALGELDQVRDEFREALAIARRIDDRRLENIARTSLAMNELDRGNLSAAESALKDVSRRWEASEHFDMADWSQLRRAEALRLQNRPQEAEMLVHEVLERTTDPRQRALGTALLAEVLADRGAIEEARRQLDSLAGPSRTSNAQVRFWIDHAGTVLEMHAQRTDRALELARLLVTGPGAATGTRQRLRARLVYGRLLVQSGEIETGRSELSSLAAEAATLGYAHVARQAAEPVGIRLSRVNQR